MYRTRIGFIPANGFLLGSHHDALIPANLETSADETDDAPRRTVAVPNNNDDNDDDDDDDIWCGRLSCAFFPTLDMTRDCRTAHCLPPVTRIILLVAAAAAAAAATFVVVVVVAAAAAAMDTGNVAILDCILAVKAVVSVIVVVFVNANEIVMVCLFVAVVVMFIADATKNLSTSNWKSMVGPGCGQRIPTFPSPHFVMSKRFGIREVGFSSR